MPKSTGASDRDGVMRRLPFWWWPFLRGLELAPQGRQHLVGEIGRAARAEAFGQRNAEDGGRDRLVDGGHDRPAPFARVRHPARELRQIRALEEREAGQVQQPRGAGSSLPCVYIASQARAGRKSLEQSGITAPEDNVVSLHRALELLDDLIHLVTPVLLPLSDM
jgi:hypothetical protein